MVGKNGKPQRNTRARADKGDGFVGAAGAHIAWGIKVEPRSVDGERGGTGENGIGGRENVKLDERIRQVTFPIHKGDAALVQRTSESRLDL